MNTVISNHKNVLRKAHHQNRSESSLELIKALGPIERVMYKPSTYNKEDKGIKY